MPSLSSRSPEVDDDFLTDTTGNYSYVDLDSTNWLGDPTYTVDFPGGESWDGSSAWEFTGQPDFGSGEKQIYNLVYQDVTIPNASSCLVFASDVKWNETSGPTGILTPVIAHMGYVTGGAFGNFVTMYDVDGNGLNPTSSTTDTASDPLISVSGSTRITLICKQQEDTNNWDLEVYSTNQWHSGDLVGDFTRTATVGSGMDIVPGGTLRIGFYVEEYQGSTLSLDYFKAHSFQRT